MNPSFHSPPLSKEQLELPIPAKEKKPLSKKIWLFLLLGSIPFILGFLLFLLQGQSIKNGQTPIPPPPEMEADLSALSPKEKKEQYLLDMQNRAKDARKQQQEAGRLERIAMSWEDVYEKEKEEKKRSSAQESVEKPSEEIPNRTRPLLPRSGAKKSDRSAYRNKEPSQTESSILKRRKEAARKSISFNTVSASGSSASSKPLAMVTAAVEGDQKVHAGQAVKFRLTQDLIAGALHIPKNTQLVGICSFGNGRVKATVSQVMLHGNILPITLKCFDQDLIEGIAYNDPRVKERARREFSTAGEDEWDQLISEVPYAGALLSATKNIAKENLRSNKTSVLLTSNYRVIFKLF